MNVKNRIVKLLVLVYLSLNLVACSMDEPIQFESSTESESDTVETSEEKLSTIFVYVSGAVVNPGVYELPEDSRKVDAIEAAGGFLAEAAKESVNLAQKLEDGLQITVKTIEAVASEQEGKVNLNTASVEDLMNLQGIGEAKAASIIQYRDESGGFRSIEELLEVNGIGDNLFQGIKDMVYVE